MNGPQPWDAGLGRGDNSGSGPAAAVRRQMAAARARCVERRALVLAHEDLARALTQPPLQHAKPEDWTGYIPPATANESMNTSPARKVLVELVAEAERRAKQAREAAG